MGLHKRVQDFGAQLFKAVKMNSEYDLVPLFGAKENLLDILYSKTNSHENEGEEIVEPTEEMLEAEWNTHVAELNNSLSKVFAEMRALSIKVRDIKLLSVEFEDVLADQITEENMKQYDIGVYRIIVHIDAAGTPYAVIANDCWNLSGGLIFGHNFYFDPSNNSGE
jgi:hypothetical protein